MPHGAETIRCPSCETEIVVADALSHALREEMQHEFAQKIRAATTAVTAREKDLAVKQAALEEKGTHLDEELHRRLEKERQSLLQTARNEARDQLRLKITDMEVQLRTTSTQLKAAEAQELELRKQRREIEDKSRRMELELQRKLDDAQRKAREEISAQAADEQRHKLAEKEKVITDLQRQIEALKQRAEQGSNQLQGEIAELDLEQQLRTTFPHDQILPVAKGQRGGDIIQQVRTNAGLECGSILWEAKRTRNWAKEWTTKLKDDQRTAKAELAVIVTRTMPPGVNGLTRIDGVWVCEFDLIAAVADVLRHGLITTTMARQSEEGRQGKMELLYAHLSGHEFRQHVEAIVETFRTLQADLEKERRAMELIWSKREKQITNVIRNTIRLYGGIQGIIGQTVLPEIRALSLEEPAEVQQDLSLE